MPLVNQLHTLLMPAEYASQVPPGRCVGKTQARAFSLLAQAMSQPGTEIVVIDHVDSPATNRELANRIVDIILKLDLKFIVVKRRPDRFTIEFQLYKDAE